ncbi:MAG TPA: hypothetical protein VFV55_02950 [Usitatibacteraceae bacterium]|nr:hypothetical protein [Usitatibacteraceae bacterium]
MKTRKNALIGLALIFGLTACAHERVTHFGRPDPHNPRVHIAAGSFVVVDQEPIYVSLKEKNFLITWHLPAVSGYVFPDDGIVIAKPDGEFDCKVQPGGERFSCTFRNSKPGRYKYTIKVLDREKGKLLEPLDPFIVNG